MRAGCFPPNLLDRKRGPIPVEEGVFDVAESGVDEHAALVPRPALDAHRLVEHAQLLELAVADRDGCFGGVCIV